MRCSAQSLRRASAGRRLHSVRAAAAPMATVPAVVVGAGRVGSALVQLGALQGVTDVLVRRGESVPAEPVGPILVATRNDSLQSVVDATPAHRRKDLVFMQNGMLEPWLAQAGLADATQLLVYFAVAKLGELPTDGRTDLEPEGLTAVHGPWAEAVATRLYKAGLACRVLDKAAFRACMFEKLIWISAFMLVGAAHPGATVGDVESAHGAQVSALVEELAAGVAASEGVAFGAALAPRLCAYARSVAHFPTALKEQPWRNGWFAAASAEALRAGKVDPYPRHTALLTQLGAFPK